ncbi:hypothetical protein CANINC_001538 [Pichia inconspicua]|uniref:Eukaryotic translation initiation factor 3 subunit J n=1 Tax=Pichia inconspicua TaxID=52247 RepID=A0A4T0X3I5_9ASCO|nr:hypothetical protein CANINC_001538 [[Candida] inconspicua]
MSWDDEDFDIPTTSATTAVDWEEGAGDDDEPVLESWDIDSDEEREKAKKAKQELKAKQEAQKAKLAAKKSGGKSKTLLEIDLVDEKTRREMLREVEITADLNNAADLFDGLGVSDHPRARATAAANAAAASQKALQLSVDTPLTVHPLFNPTTKAEFEKLRKTLATTMHQLADKSALFYANGLAIDLARDICDPLSVEQIRKVISTLNVLVTKKVKDERLNRLKKTNGTSLGGAGKKKVKSGQVNTGPASFRKDNLDDFLDDDGGISDDDFM